MRGLPLAMFAVADRSAEQAGVCRLAVVSSFGSGPRVPPTGERAPPRQVLAVLVDVKRRLGVGKKPDHVLAQMPAQQAMLEAVQVSVTSVEPSGDRQFAACI